MGLTMRLEYQELLIEGAEIFGLRLTGRELEAFDLYLQELLKWNQKMNLTAIRSEKGVVLKHFLDSLSAHPYLSKATRLLDIGSGAGFPGIPLKIVEPTLEVTMIDSVLKKVAFQKHMIRILRLKGIVAIHGRIEERRMIQEMAEQFDTVISRAFSNVRTLLSLALPYLKRGGTLIAMRGRTEKAEELLVSMGQEMGYRLRGSASFVLPKSPYERSILLFEKG